VNILGEGTMPILGGGLGKVSLDRFAIIISVLDWARLKLIILNG
jgi:hypothetical protein